MSREARRVTVVAYWLAMLGVGLYALWGGAGPGDLFPGVVFFLLALPVSAVLFRFPEFLGGAPWVAAAVLAGVAAANTLLLWLVLRGVERAGRLRRAP